VPFVLGQKIPIPDDDPIPPSPHSRRRSLRWTSLPAFAQPVAGTLPDSLIRIPSPVPVSVDESDCCHRFDGSGRSNGMTTGTQRWRANPGHRRLHLQYRPR
jgi:hypothetical protein